MIPYVGSPQRGEPTYETPYTKSQTPLNGPNNTRSIMANSPITDVIFDFCGVLLDWNTRACLEGRFPDFHLAFEKYPRLEQLLQGTMVSGVEKMHKPNADIYELALTRFGLTAERCVFFDDTAKNIVGANEVGIHGILFENALQARESLAELGVRL